MEGSVRRERPSATEIANRIDGARHAGLQSEVAGLDCDTQFDILYDSAYKWCEVVLRAEGWRTAGGGHHEAVFSGLLHFLGEDVSELAYYFDHCRGIRHDFHYDWRPCLASEVEVGELRQAVRELESRIISWLQSKHPDLMPIV